MVTIFITINYLLSLSLLPLLLSYHYDGQFYVTNIVINTDVNTIILIIKIYAYLIRGIQSVAKTLYFINDTFKTESTIFFLDLFRCSRSIYKKMFIKIILDPCFPQSFVISKRKGVCDNYEGDVSCLCQTLSLATRLRTPRDFLLILFLCLYSYISFVLHILLLTMTFIRV